jgi:hypothetical protein
LGDFEAVIDHLVKSQSLHDLLVALEGPPGAALIPLRNHELAFVRSESLD